uniref:Uncharacterized protein n=1 Tax=Siphoviridae sp. ctrgQ8 TaxID=2825689 RepID=A0A8S5PNZ1_9CAUD|nr:MAG TPA: hypothetical protein [Siphoviridae sp. ctrgQ8]
MFGYYLRFFEERSGASCTCFITLKRLPPQIFLKSSSVYPFSIIFMVRLIKSLSPLHPCKPPPPSKSVPIPTWSTTYIYNQCFIKSGTKSGTFLVSYYTSMMYVILYLRNDLFATNILCKNKDLIF